MYICPVRYASRKLPKRRLFNCLLVKAVEFFFCIFQSHDAASQYLHWFYYSRKQQLLRIRRGRVPVMLMAANVSERLMDAVPDTSLPKRKHVHTRHMLPENHGWNCPHYRTGQLLRGRQRAGNFSVLHKFIPYIPAVLRA